MMRRMPILAVFVLFTLGVARAADQTVLGSALVVKNPGVEAKRKVTVKARESFTNATLVGDPVADGASVTIALNGANPSEATYALPAGTSAKGRPFWKGDPTKGFKYGDPTGENGPVKRAQIKLKNGVFQIKVVVDGKLAPVVLVPPAPGTDACALVTIAGGDSYSVRFAGGDQTNDGAVLFKVVKPTVEGSCLPSTTTSTSTPTTSTSSTTTTLAIPFVPPPGEAPLRYRDLVFDTVTTTLDVVYGSAVNYSGQTVVLELDVYEPTDDLATERPTIVWVHGGGFAFGDKSSAELVDQATVFSRKGYLNVSINYRLEPGGCSAGAPTVECVVAVTEAHADAQTAIRFLRDNAAVYGVDTDRIAIGGSSAGAITALNVGFTSSEDPTAAVAGAVSLSGGRLLGAVDAGDAPSLLFHGTADTIVPYQWAVNTVNAATAVGLDSFLTTWVGAGHVPYLAHRTEILDQTTNFLWWEMDLANAAQ
jgi:acetyl esterase/lipase